MIQTFTPIRAARTAVILGFLALFVNAIVRQFLPPDVVQPGNLFLFLSAQALGIPGALISLTIGVIPDALSGVAHMHFIRLSVLCLGIAYSTHRYPRLPAFVVGTALWVFLIGPCLLLDPKTMYSPNPTTTAQILVLGLSEILLLLTSGAFLLNTTIWGALTYKPFQYSLFSLLTHITTLIATLSMFALIKLFGEFEANAIIGAPRAIGIVVFILAVSPLIGWRLAAILGNNFQEFFASNLLSSGQNRSFSGLSSEYWRRKNTAEMDTPIHGSSGSSSDNDMVMGDSPGLKVPVHTGVCALNRDGTITFVNRRFRKLTEMKMNDVLGKKIESVGVHPTILKNISDLLETTFKKGPRTFELKLNELPKKLRFFELASQLSDAFESSSVDGGPDSVIITIRDITDRRTVEEHLLKGQKVDSLGNIVTGLAHAFNNVLTSITGQASYGKHSQNQKESEKCFTDIIDSAQQAGKLVRELLEYSDGQPGLTKIENVTSLIEQKLNFFNTIVGDSFEIDFSKPANPVSVRCDSNLLIQAITNIVMNAKEAYTSDYGKIFISVDTEELDEEVADLLAGARPGKFARLRIKDEGFGMNPEILARAFDPLFTTKSSSGHAGLGLSIAYTIVRAHDGFLSMESHPEKGTTISIYLPLEESHQTDTLVPESVDPVETDVPLISEKRDGTRGRILVVEDDPNVRKLVSMMLATLGYKTENASNGEEALATCRTENFDLLLVDMMMPKMHGLEFLSKIKDEKPGIKTLLMTGYGIAGETFDVDTPVIAKPFDLETLEKAINSCLEAKGNVIVDNEKDEDQDPEVPTRE